MFELSSDHEDFRRVVRDFAESEVAHAELDEAEVEHAVIDEADEHDRAGDERRDEIVITVVDES